MIGGQMFAVGIELVQEVVEWEPLEPVPKAPDFTLGVFNYHGRIIAVVDLAEFFGEKSGEVSEETRVVALAGDDMNLGFKVDKAERIENFDERRVRDGAERSKDMEFIKAVVNHDSRLYNLIDFEQLLEEIEERFSSTAQRSEEYRKMTEGEI